MKITKYEHACFTVEKDGQVLVVDPGEFATDFIAPSGVAAIVFTHEHFDHFDPERLADIINENPEALIVAPEAVTAKIEAFSTRAVAAGDTVTVGPFTLEFHGGQHAVIHASYPPVANLGVFINDLLYYPGDALTLTHKPVDTLALPAAAPWLKIGEAIDFLTAIRPRLAFPTHDAILSDVGKELVDRILDTTARGIGTEYQRIDTLEI